MNNIISESNHAYVVNGQTWSGSKTSYYLGDQSDIPITEDGRRHTGYSTFALNIAPDNSGVVLKRIYDHSISNQKANVYVDDEYVRQWLNAGSNTSLSREDSDFMIPVSFTYMKS